MIELKCDVLVIGGGIAGCWAALKAKQLVPRVILIDKARVSRSGKSSFAGAGILCPLDHDDLDIWHREIVEKGQYISDQDWVRVLLQEQERRIRDLERWGVIFLRDEKGSLARNAALGQINTKVVHTDSFKLMEILRKQLEESGVVILDRIMVTNLLTSDGIQPTKGSVVGALGFHTRSGETYVINSGAAIIASGGTAHFDLTGDGIAQAFRVGAETYNMEFSSTYLDLGFEEKYFGIHFITFQRLGMILVNADGERFMRRYQPVEKEKAKRVELCWAVLSEGMQGRAPIYMDLTHFNQEQFEILQALPRNDRFVKALKRDGVDLKKNKVKFTLSSGTVNTRGGIRNNIYCETNIPGLYVAGEASGIPPDGAGSIPVKLATCCVGGYRAGDYAARYTLEYGPKDLNKEQTKNLEAEFLKPLYSNKGISPQSLKDSIHDFLSPAQVSIFRSSASLKAILKQIEKWDVQAQSLRASDPYELTEANKIKNYILCVEMVFRTSLEREETRGNNLRIDFPYRDNLKWLKWIIMSKPSKEERNLYTVPIPIYRYPVKPEQYDKMPINLPT